MPKSLKEFQELFDKAGISIDDPINRIFLPDATGKSVYLTQRTLHSGSHSDKYSRTAKEKAKDYLKQGLSENWSPEMYRGKIMELVSPLKKGLISGEIPLNNAKTLLQKFQEK